MFFCQISFYSNAQTLEQLTIENGLPSSTVYNIFQDSLGFIWLATNNGVVKYDGYKFNTVDFKSINSSNDIWEIYDDSEGRIWFSGEQKLVYLQNDSIHSIPFPERFKSSLINYHDIDTKGNHFVYFDARPFKVEIEPSSGKASLSKIFFTNIENCTGLSLVEEDDDGVFWYTRLSQYSLILCKSYDNKILIDTDTIVYNTTPYSFKYLYQYPQRTADGNYFFATEQGIYGIDLKKGKMSLLDILPKDTAIKRATLQNENISTLNTNKGVLYLDKHLNLIEDIDFTKNIEPNIVYEDDKKNIWFCTFDKGVYFLNGKIRQFKKVVKDIKGNDLTDIFDTAKDPSGNIWFTNNSNNIWKLNQNNEAIPYDLSKYINKKIEVLRYIEFDNAGNLYLSSSRHSVFVFANEHVKNGQFQQKEGNLSHHSSRTFVDLSHQGVYNFKLNFVKHISKTTDGTIIMGGPSYSLIIKPIHETKIEYYSERSGRNYAATIWKNYLAFGKTNELAFLPQQENIPKVPLVFQQSIETLFTDRENKLWIGTKNNGLYIYDGKTISNISETSQLQLRISNIVQVADNYWLSTNKGIARIYFDAQDSSKYDFKLFSEEHGLINSQVQEISVIGEHLYVATIEGINIIDIAQLNDPSPPRPIYFTECSLNGKDTLIHFDDYKKEHLKLRHNINNIKIKFTSLPYFMEEYIHYEYRSQGIQEDWQTLDINLKEFNINTLKFGKYTFQVRARNINGIVSEPISFNFQIMPPWWKTWWAYSCYFIAIFSILYLIAGQIFKRREIQAENHTLAAINKAKTNFFTNITHELRTPLTMIMGLTQLEESKKNNQSKSLFNDLNVHTKTMLHLINQLLDISKLEVGATSLYLEVGDLIQFCRNIVNIFAKHAKTKNQHLHFYTNTDSLMTPFDAEKIERILYNILSNAVKYTQETGTIDVVLTVKESGSEFQIEIADNGPGIDRRLLDTIFNKFSHGNNAAQSSGIGLYLAKELAKFMDGDIDVRSGARGSTFTITIPLVENSSKLLLSQNPYELPLNHRFNDESHIDFQFHQHESLPNLLLVDDNIDILRLLRKMLMGRYKIVVAQNGKEGLNLAQDIVPELIISDIMMPEMDGYELCKRLKENRGTSHIPILLLSAKDTKEAQVKGISLGADAYIKKPFDFHELSTIIEHLILNRKLLRDRYSNLEKVQNKPQKDIEDKFVLRLRSIIVDNISNTDLDVNTLCNEMFMSRTQLHNKLKYTTGISARRFIRKIRLERAKELLAHSDIKISGIAIEIGMDAKYFSRIFHKTYGERPSEYRKRKNWDSASE